MKKTKTKIFKIVFIANAILSATIIINEPVKKLVLLFMKSKKNPVDFLLIENVIRILFRIKNFRKNEV